MQNIHEPHSCLNIAHRGARAYAPENTLEAFAKAKSFGCEMFELDVRRSKEGVLMVFHDENLLRCTNVAVKFPDRSHADLSEFNYDEIRQLDAGSWFVEQLALLPEQRQAFLTSLTTQERAAYISHDELKHFASGKVKVPTLQEAIELAMHHDMQVNIELKELADDTGFVEAVVALVETLSAEQQVLISSFDHALLKRLRACNSTIPQAVLTVNPIDNVIDYLKSLDAAAFHPCCYRTEPLTGKRDLHIDEFQRVREAGFAVNTWTCNNQLDMRQILANGVDGLVSDFPNRVREVRGF